METTCALHPDSPADLSDHVGQKPCTVAAKREVRAWYDLPIAAALWAADALEVER